MKRFLPRLGVLAAVIALTAQAVGALPSQLPGPPLALAQQTTGALEQPRSADAGINFDAIQRRTAELRGLVPQRDVPRTVLSPDQFRQRLIDDLSTEDSREEDESRGRLIDTLLVL